MIQEKERIALSALCLMSEGREKIGHNRRKGRSSVYIHLLRGIKAMRTLPSVQFSLLLLFPRMAGLFKKHRAWSMIREFQGGCGKYRDLWTQDK